MEFLDGDTGSTVKPSLGIGLPSCTPRSPQGVASRFAEVGSEDASELSVNTKSGFFWYRRRPGHSRLGAGAASNSKSDQILPLLNSHPMNVGGSTAHSTSVPNQLRRLYRIPKTSQKFGPALEQFFGNAECENIVDNLDDAELEKFIDFLDEVRRPAYRSGGPYDRSTRCCRLKA